MLRTDKAILVLPPEYVEELRALPESQVSAVHAHVEVSIQRLWDIATCSEGCFLFVQNLLGSYTTTDVLLKSKLHVHMLQTKLTPSLGNLFPIIQDELEDAMEKEMPVCNGMSAHCTSSHCRG